MRHPADRCSPGSHESTYSEKLGYCGSWICVEILALFEFWIYIAESGHVSVFMLGMS